METDVQNTNTVVEEKPKTNFSDFSSLLGEDSEGNPIPAPENKPAEEGAPQDGTVAAKTEEVKEGEGGQEKVPDVVVEEDIFLEASKKEEEGGEPVKVAEIDWKTQGMKFGLELPDNTEESFNKAFEEKINKARQEVNLDNYDPLTKDVISFIGEKKGDPIDFILSDEIIETKRFMKLSDEDKYREARFHEIANLDKSKTDDEIHEVIDNELETIDDRKFSQIINNINNGAKSVYDKAVKAIIDKKNEQIERERKLADESRIEKRNSLKSKITGMNSFVGMKVSDPFKNILLSQIDNGEVERFLETNQQEAMLYGYLHMKFGDKVVQYFNEKIKTDARQSYNAGVQRVQSTLHHIPDKQAVTTGHASPNVSISDKPGWKDMQLD